MDRTEQKVRLKSIIEDVQGLISELEGIENESMDIFGKIEDLSSTLTDIDVDFDEEELKAEVLINLVENRTEFPNVKYNIEEFKDEIEEYAYDLSDNRRDKLEERYEDLEMVVELLDLEECNSIDDLIKNLNECIGYLKEMRK